LLVFKTSAFNRSATSPAGPDSAAGTRSIQPLARTGSNGRPPGRSDCAGELIQGIPMHDTAILLAAGALLGGGLPAATQAGLRRNRSPFCRADHWPRRLAKASAS
jgi:hypothetical protein